MHYAYTILTLKLYMYIGLINVSLSATTFFRNDRRPVLVRVEVEVCKNDCYNNKAQFLYICYMYVDTRVHLSLSRNELHIVH